MAALSPPAIIACARMALTSIEPPMHFGRNIFHHAGQVIVAGDRGACRSGPRGRLEHAAEIVCFGRRGLRQFRLTHQTAHDILPNSRHDVTSGGRSGQGGPRRKLGGIEALTPFRRGRRRGGRWCRRGEDDSRDRNWRRVRPRSNACAHPCRPSAAQEIAVAGPDFHGVALDQPIGVLARDAFLRQRQAARAANEPARRAGRGSFACSRDRRRACRSTPASRLSAKSSVTVASGPIMRSTEECEMSRSCHSATFSSAGTT